MFNKQAIKEGVERLAREAFVQGVDNSAVELLLSQVKNYADDSLEEAFFARAEDEVVLSTVDREAFLHFSTGYVRQMRDWHRDNAAELQPVNIDWEQVVQQVSIHEEERVLVKKHLVRAGVLTTGAIVVATLVGLVLPASISVSGGIITGLLAELIVLSYVYRSYKSEVQVLKAMEQKRIEREMQSRISQIVSSIVQAISDWLDAAERASRSIETSFAK